jgi:hypothetical protein
VALNFGRLMGVAFLFAVEILPICGRVSDQIGRKPKGLQRDQSSVSMFESVSVPEPRVSGLVSPPISPAVSLAWPAHRSMFSATYIVVIMIVFVSVGLLVVVMAVSVSVFVFVVVCTAHRLW